MKKNQIVLLGIGLLAFLFVGNNSFGQGSLDKKTLVTIGGEEVTVSEFMQIYEKNNAQSSVQEPSTIEEYLNLFINFKLKVREAEDLKMDTAKDFVEELKGYRDQLAKPYFIDESVNEDLLKEAYNRMQSDVRASHILLMVNENARPEDTLKAYNKIVQIREEIMAGKDFNEAAVEYSEDPSARDREEIPGKQRFHKGNRGDLGYFTVFNMVYPFENAAYNTPVGEVSQPVRTKFGYHLVKVTDRKDALGKAQVAHIYAALTPNSTAEDSVAQKEKIFNIYEKILDGMPYEDAVIQYSEDKGSARNGGKLSPFTCNRVVPEFVLAAESLDTNEISEPVQTLYGWHIIKLISRDRPGTFEEESEKIKEKLKKDSRSQKSEEVVLQRIKKDNKLKIYDKARLEIVSLVDTSVLNGAFKADTLTAYQTPVMKIGDAKYTQYDFALFAQKNQSRQSNIDKDVYVGKLFNSFVDDECLAYEDKHLEENYPEFRALIKEYHDGILLFDLTDQKVWTKAVKDTVGLENYFNEHNDRYTWKERADATVYQFRNQDDQDKILAIVKENESDGTIAQLFDEDSIKNVRIIPGKFETGDNKYVDQTEWKAGTINIITSDVDNTISIVKIKAVLPPQKKKFDESRGIATADYQEYLEKNWIKQLREKYPVTVNQEVLDKLVAAQ